MISTKEVKTGQCKSLIIIIFVNLTFSPQLMSL